MEMDGKYDYRNWDQEPEGWSYTGPFASHEEQLMHQALSVQHMTRQEVQTYVQPALAQVQPFRPRYGYPEVQERQAEIEDIVGVSRNITIPQATWFSGGPAGYTGSPRYMSNSLGLA